MHDTDRCIKKADLQENTVQTGEQISVYTGRENAGGSGFKLLWLSILSSITELFCELGQFALTQNFTGTEVSACPSYSKISASVLQFFICTEREQHPCALWSTVRV